MINSLRFLALALLISGCCQVSLASTLIVDSETTEVSITPFLKILEDPSNSWSLEDAKLRFSTDTPITIPGGVPNFGLTTSTYWFSLDVRSNLSEKSDWLFEIQYPLIDEVQFAFLEEGDWQIATAGDLIPFGSRQVLHPTLVFKLSLDPGEEKQIFLNANTEGSVQLPAKLWRPDAFTIAARDDFFFLGTYLGIMLAMVLYNLFVYSSVRDESYLYYILYVVCISMFNLSNRGLDVQYIWPTNPAIGAYSVTVSAYLAATFALLFCKSYLQVAEYAPRLNRVLNVFVGVMATSVMLPFVLSYQLATNIGSISALLSAMLLLYSGLSMALKGQRAARYFFVAWLVFLIAVVLIAIQRLGFIEGNFIVEQGTYIGTSLEVILLSLGLADRINTLRREKTEVQAELVQRNTETIAALQQANAIKDEFVANVSHELRTPLTGIIGLSEVVLANNKDRLDDGSRLNLNMIRSSGQRLTSLVNDIVDISAINRNYLEVDLAPMDLRSTARFVLGMCQPMLGSKPVKLVSGIPEDTPLVYADENRITQVFFNLVANAIKFTAEGTITISAHTDKTDLKISISDTGIGIPENKREEIFEPFMQLDSSIDRKVGGTGLGLSITKKIIELHNSHIEVSSNTSGSVFSFCLPIAETQTAPFKPQQTTIEFELPESPITELRAEPPDQSRRSVLIVDDEYTNLHILQEFLRPYCEVILAQDGFEALDALNTHNPDMMIVDLMMPRMSGYELCLQVREDHTPADLPILILTAKTQTEDLIESLRAGANDYLSKPFHREELIARVQKQLQLKELIEVRDLNTKLGEQVDRFRQSEQSLHTSQLRLAAMLDYGEESLICVDARGTIAHANRNVAEFFGVDKSALEGRPVDILFHSITDDKFTFPFDQSVISADGSPNFIDCEPGFGTTPIQKTLAQVCILTLNLEQEFYILIFSRAAEPVADIHSTQLIAEVNKNAQRTQSIGALLGQMTPAILEEQPHLISELEKIDAVISTISSNVDVSIGEQTFRQTLVKLMLESLSAWERVTQRTVIDLAEESGIWRISIDNGRLRARSMERYLDESKLPKNPRWREVVRTAYYVLGHLDLDANDKDQLEQQIKAIEQYTRA